MAVAGVGMASRPLEAQCKAFHVSNYNNIYSSIILRKNFSEMLEDDIAMYGCFYFLHYEFHYTSYLNITLEISHKKIQ